MKTLHTLNKINIFSVSHVAPYLSSIQPNDALLLLEDGVYGAVEGSHFFGCLVKHVQLSQVFCLSSDAKARGITRKLSTAIKLIDYAQFVELSAKNSRVISWY